MTSGKTGRSRQENYLHETESDAEVAAQGSGDRKTNCAEQSQVNRLHRAAAKGKGTEPKGKLTTLSSREQSNCAGQ